MCLYIFRGLDALRVVGNKSPAWACISFIEVIKCLEDLIDYFAQPNEDEGKIEGKLP